MLPEFDDGEFGSDELEEEIDYIDFDELPEETDLGLFEDFEEEESLEELKE